MDADALLSLIASRRSNLLIDNSRDVDASLIDSMISAAQWAPNHKRTWPARFCVVAGDSRFVLGDAIAGVMAAQGDEPFKVEKTKTKYARTPYVLIVAAANGNSASETEENRYSVAAGIQNMLLMAHAHGLAALWGSPAKGSNDAITAFAGFELTDHVLGLIYVGWPSQNVPVVERPAPNVTHRS